MTSPTSTAAHYVYIVKGTPCVCLLFTEIDRRKKGRRKPRTLSQDRDSHQQLTGGADDVTPPAPPPSKPRSSQRRRNREPNAAAAAADVSHGDDATTAAAASDDETISAAASPTKHHVTYEGIVAREPTGLEDTPASVSDVMQC